MLNTVEGGTEPTPYHNLCLGHTNLSKFRNAPAGDFSCLSPFCSVLKRGHRVGGTSEFVERRRFVVSSHPELEFELEEEIDCRRGEARPSFRKGLLMGTSQPLLCLRLPGRSLSLCWHRRERCDDGDEHADGRGRGRTACILSGPKLTRPFLIDHSVTAFVPLQGAILASNSSISSVYLVI